MGGLERFCEFVAAGLDATSAGGPTRVQPWVDTFDFADRAASRLGGAVDESDTQVVGQVAFQGGVVGFRGGHFALNNTCPSMLNHLPSRFVPCSPSPRV